jgi:hypothetical protein
MPIIDISEVKQTETVQETVTSKDRFFSSMTARILFFVLLLGDIAWAVWTLVKMALFLPIFLLTLGRNAKVGIKKCWISLKRAGVCGISLVIALFSPALGIMVACTYFLMYDKSGIEDVVPRSLQDQFQDFLKESK